MNALTRIGSPTAPTVHMQAGAVRREAGVVVGRRPRRTAPPTSVSAAHCHGSRGTGRAAAATNVMHLGGDARCPCTTVSTPLTSPSFVVPSSLAVSSFCVALRWWFTAKAMSEANVMTPKPPICTEKMSTAWPKADQCVVELTMEMPHVEYAEIAVKNAVVNVVARLSVWRRGDEQERRGQRTQKREVQDGQASGMRGEFVHQAAFARLALLCHGLFERVSGEPQA